MSYLPPLSLESELISEADIQVWLIKHVSVRLGLPPDHVDPAAPFASYGLSSRDAVALSGELQNWLGRDISPVITWEHPTIAQLAHHLGSPPSIASAQETEPTPAFTAEPIAIIGFSCRFPGAENPEAFWELLVAGKDAITRTDQQGRGTTRPTSATGADLYGGFLDHVDQFDPQFFGVSPREAIWMDPQQRILLEVAWEALERAGQSPAELAGSKTGVFVGISSSDYMRLQLSSPETSDAYTGPGTAFSVAANRLSYVLDLHGPSVAVDTACSSSLVAVHLACQSLSLGEATMALAGGVNLILSPELTDVFTKAGMMAADGLCKTFDADADGYVRSEGCGVVVLKPLATAVRDANPVLGIIRSSAINQDGRSNGLTAPNGVAQQEVIRAALAKARVSPAQIGYVELHGTGTPLGDPIEVQSLAAVLQEGRPFDLPCLIGSVKANIGHLEAAAGIAGLIKVLLCLQHGELVPQIHLDSINPHIPLADLPLSIPHIRQSWPSYDQPRLAGVSSFGFGGTNAHLVVQEAPRQRQTMPAVERPAHLLCLSARSEQALRQLAHDYVNHTIQHPSQSIADMCFTAQRGRSHFSQRLAVVADTHATLVEQLQSYAAGARSATLSTGQVQRQAKPKIAFLFSGQGAQYTMMGRQLYETQPVFREALDRCATILDDYLDHPLLSVLYPTTDSQVTLNATEYTQPALFALEYALAVLWHSWGIEPDIVFGHSVGQYVAACLAGVFSLEDGLALIAERARLMQHQTQPGQMTVVLADAAQVTAALLPYQGQVTIAAINGPANTVISGVTAAVRAVVQQLEQQGIETRPLRVSHAFHSPLMEPIQDAFEHGAQFMRFSAPRIPMVCDQTGHLLEPGYVPDAAHWRHHICAPVQFATGVQTLAAQGCQIFIEIGPNPVLIGMGRRCIADTSLRWLPSIKDKRSDWEMLLAALGSLYVAGIDIDWQGFEQSYHRQRVMLPTYPFERKSYWLPLTQVSTPALPSTTQQSAVAAACDTKASPMISEPGHTRTNSPVLVRNQSVAQHEAVLERLRAIVGRLTMLSPADVDPNLPFLEMGADSIVLIEAVHAIEKTFSLKISIRQIFESLTTPQALAQYIVEHSPVVAQEMAAPAVECQSAEQIPAQPQLHRLIESSPPPTENVPLHLASVMNQQLEVLAQVMRQQTTQQLEVLSQVITQQNEVLRTHGAAAATFPAQPERVERVQQPITQSTAIKQSAPSVILPTNSSAAAVRAQQPEVFVPYQPLKPHGSSAFTTRQQQHLEALIERYVQRTAQSKRLTQASRDVLADNRASAGFRFSIKEMLYPIIAETSQGSKIWDVDGNEYLDVSMGFGVNLFGHGAPFITEALEEQLKRGIQLGPQAMLAGEVAQLIHELTGMERVTFCNSGTEAIMTAVRLARTATGRSKIAIFAGSYHGTFDGVLARVNSSTDSSVGIPIAPGIPELMVQDVLVLDYGQPSALERIRECAHELAGVLVEPVQSRRPDLQPTAFLHELRQITAQAEIALIFDEVITGFRIHPGGAQAWFGIQADIATYGKVVGGGMPIGVVAGRALYINGIDGGTWQYGDASFPQAETTFFAGTFCKHPLAMAAARAVLRHLKDQGPALQEEINQRTAQFAAHMNSYFVADQVPINIVHFGSLFRFAFTGNMDLLFYHLQEKGIYIWEGRNCFFSTAHTDADVERLVQAILESVQEMRAGGFLPPSASGGSNGTPPAGLPQPESSMPTRDIPTVLIDVTQAHAAQPNVTPLYTCPLTMAQQQLWFLAQLSPDASAAYHNHILLDLHGPLLIERLRQAFEQVVARHEALRTTISAEGDAQLIWAHLPLDFEIIDMVAESEMVREANAAQWLLTTGQQTLDLVRGPLLRIRLLRLDAERHRLIVTLHQIIADGWSMGVLITEVGQVYTAICQNHPSPLTTPLQFREYVAWVTQPEHEAAMAEAEKFWLAQFAGTLPILDLPLTQPRPASPSFAGSRLRLRLSAGLVHDLKRFSSQHKSTLFMTALATFKVLLYRLTRQTDLIVGTPSAGRDLDGASYSVGNFTNVLAVRTKIAGEQSFTSYLGTVRDAILDVQEHHMYPFPLLVQKINPPRDPSRFPIISVLFNMDRALSLPTFNDLQLQLQPYPTSYADVDLNLNITQEGEELLIDASYKTELFDHLTIQRYLEYYQVLLQGICANPTAALANLPLLSSEEQDELLETWNATSVTYPHVLCAHQLFEAQVAQHPEAIAASYEDQQISYRELNRRANQLACTLRGVGVRPETRVGLCVDRSIDMLVGLLGILKADGAYVPLDPTYPPERIAFVIADAEIAVLLTQEHLVTLLPTHHAQVLYIQSETTELEQLDNVSNNSSSDHLAYMIYTSGSTGKPKGVQITHRSLVNFLMTMSQRPGMTSQDVLLAVTTLSFDIAGLELLLPLTVGARVVIASRATAADGKALGAQLAASEATMMQATPATWRLLLADGWHGTGGFTALCGGEALPRDLANQLLHHKIHLWNMYGPTETTIWSAIHQVIEEPGAVPIGRPIANTQLYLLDQMMQPVPRGTIGELYIGGDGLARGYFKRPHLTADHFVPHPFSTKPGARLYRTGDLARYRGDGQVEYLGRTDLQVKLRGFRIELGEIESLLNQHPAIRETVVIVRTDSPGHPVLTAYVVPDQAAAPTTSELRNFLRHQLPDYMIPTSFMLLDALPRTPNQKVDRQALPAPTGERPALETTFTAPRSPVESVLVQIWTELLGLKRVGVHDNFFDLGGHSLIVTQMVSRLNKLFRLNLPLHDLFDASTIADLAELLRRYEAKPGQSEQIAQNLQKIKGMSAAEMKQALEQQKKKRGTT